jgi:hypothetical protein
MVKGTILARQPVDSDSVEMALTRARGIADKLGAVGVLYFIDMAILEARGIAGSAEINNRLNPRNDQELRN